MNPEYAPETCQNYMAYFYMYWEQFYGPCTITHETELTDDLIDKIIHVKLHIYNLSR